MFKIYIKNFMQNGQLNTSEALLQEVPVDDKSMIRLLAPNVKNEMGNAESFSFGIQPGTKYYDAFLQMKTYIRVMYENACIFYGRVLTIDNGFFGERKIRCEGAFSLFIDSSYPGKEEKYRPNQSTYSYMQSIINNHNSQVSDNNKRFILGNVPGNYSGVSSEQQIKNDTRKFGQDSYTDTKSALEDLRSHYGGYFRTRAAGKIGDGIYLDWLNHYFNSNVISQTVEVSKNILDLSDTTEVDNIFTAIIPIGKTTSNDTSKSHISLKGYRTDIHGDNEYLKVSDICKIYTDGQLESGYHKASDYHNAESQYGLIFKTVSLSDADNQAKLFTEACEWIKNNYQPAVTKYNVKAVDMRQIGENTSKILVGDRVRIIYPVGKEDGSIEKQELVLTCLSVDFDLYNPENNQYTFGIPANVLTKTYGLNKKSKSTNDGASSYKGSGGNEEESDEDKYRKWFNELIGWLQEHTVVNTARTPYHRTLFVSGTQTVDIRTHFIEVPEIYEAGISNMYKMYFANMENNHVHEPGDEGYEFGNWFFKVGSMHNYSMPVLLNQIEQNNIFEYVLFEYHIDLRSGLTNKMPLMTNDPDTGYATIWTKASVSTETGIHDFLMPTITTSIGQKMALKGSMDFSGGLFRVLSDPSLINPQGEALISADTYAKILSINSTAVNTTGSSFNAYLASGGQYPYFGLDAANGLVNYLAGNQVYSLQNLHIKAVDTEDMVGWVVTKDNQGHKKFANPGEMTLAIENFVSPTGTHYNLVTANVAGQLTYIGNNETRYTATTALNHMDQVCGDIDYVTGPDGYKIIYAKTAGGFRVRRGKRDANGNIQLDPTGEVIYADYGLYDDNNLTGGIVVEKINDDTTVTKIKGNRVDIEASQVRVGNTTNVQNWLAQNEQDIDDVSGLLADKITAYEGYFANIQADYLKTTNLKTAFGNITTVSAQSIQSSGNITVSGYLTGNNVYANDFKVNYSAGVIGPSADSKSLKDALNNLKVISAGNNSYKIQYLDYNNPTTWKDFKDSNNNLIATFSTATALSGTWSSGILDVEASPQGEHFYRQLARSGITWDTDKKGVRVYITSKWGSDYQYIDHTSDSSTDWSTWFSTVTSYNAGSDAAGVTAEWTGANKATYKVSKAANTPTQSLSCTITISPSVNKTLGFGESVTVYARGNLEDKASVTITAPAKPSVPHTVSGFNTTSPKNQAIGSYISNSSGYYVISGDGTYNARIGIAIKGEWTCDGVSRSGLDYVADAPTAVYKYGWNKSRDALVQRYFINTGSSVSGGNITYTFTMKQSTSGADGYTSGKGYYFYKS